VVVGAGYIAVELAGILQVLGSDVSLLIRYDKVVSCIHVIFYWYSVYPLLSVCCNEVSL